jgi:competence protein ComEA
MKKKRINSQQMGLCILILILLLGWGINYLFSLQRDLGSKRRGNDIYIMISGEIKNSGVYVFDREHSLKELIVRAGGLKAKLMPKKWDKYPYVTQGTSIQISSENGYIKVSTGSIPATYKVILKIPISVNTASHEELDTIPDIGPTLAKKIVNYRSLYGPFKTVEDVRNVPGMGKLRCLKIKPYIGI